MLDRVLHHSIIVSINGESYRLKDKRKADYLLLLPNPPNIERSREEAGPQRRGAAGARLRFLKVCASVYMRPVWLNLMPRYQTEVFEDTFDATIRRGAVCFAQGACMRVDDPRLNLKARSAGDCAGSECSPNAV